MSHGERVDLRGQSALAAPHREPGEHQGVYVGKMSTAGVFYSLHADGAAHLVGIDRKHRADVTADAQLVSQFVHADGQEIMVGTYAAARKCVSAYPTSKTPGTGPLYQSFCWVTVRSA